MKKISLLFLLFSLVIYGCTKITEAFDPSPNLGEGKVLTNITGIVLDEKGMFLPGVTVTVGGKQAITNEDGQFNIAELTVDENRFYVKAIKLEYFDGGAGVIPVKNGISTTSITLVKMPTPTVINNPSISNEITVDQAKIVFQPNSFVTTNGAAYNGPVNVHAKLLSPADANFAANIPGGDLVAQDADGSQSILESYGMIGVELSVPNSNQKLQLGQAKTAEIQIPISQSQISKAPDTIPLWSFDAVLGHWIREGVAKKVGNLYIGSVKHFSWWNCDVRFPLARLSGIVLDCNNRPAAGALVFADNWRCTQTDQNGRFTGLVPLGFDLSNLRVVVGGASFQEVDFLNIPSGNVTSNTNITLNVDCPSLTWVTGKINNCTNDIPPFSIRVFWGDNYQYGTQASVFNETFRVLVPSNKSLKIRVASAGYAQDSIIPALNRGSSFDFGTKNVCVKVPKLTTNDLTNITANTAVSGGEVFDSSQVTIKQRGVCWSLYTKPTTGSLTKTIDGSGWGKFTSTLTGLKPNTKYYVRAYAIANAGATFYGDEKSFTTPAQ